MFLERGEVVSDALSPAGSKGYCKGGSLTARICCGEPWSRELSSLSSHNILFIPDQEYMGCNQGTGEASAPPMNPLGRWMVTKSCCCGCSYTSRPI